MYLAAPHPNFPLSDLASAIPEQNVPCLPLGNPAVSFTKTISAMPLFLKYPAVFNMEDERSD